MLYSFTVRRDSIFIVSDVFHKGKLRILGVKSCFDKPDADTCFRKGLLSPWFGEKSFYDWQKKKLQTEDLTGAEQDAVQK